MFYTDHLKIPMPKTKKPKEESKLREISGIRNNDEFNFYWDKIKNGSPELGESLKELFLLAKLSFADECPDFEGEFRRNQEEKSRREKRKHDMAVQLRDDVIKLAVPIIKRRQEVLARVKKHSNYKIHNYEFEDRKDILTLIKSNHIRESFLVKNLSVNEHVNDQVPWADQIGMNIPDFRQNYYDINFSGGGDPNICGAFLHDQENINYWNELLEQHMIENP